MIKQLRINERIRAKEVRLIGEAGKQLGVMPLVQALRMAEEQGADLVEVAPSATPPVCRLLDYGKFKYEQTKKEREARKRQKTALLRQVRLRPKINTHDIESKTRLIQKLLGEGDKVRVFVIFRGREITHPELGKGLLDRISQELGEVAAVEKTPSMEGRQMSIILSPTKKAKAPKENKE